VFVEGLGEAFVVTPPVFSQKSAQRIEKEGDALRFAVQRVHKSEPFAAQGKKK